MKKSTLHKVYYKFTFTIKVIQDAVSSFSYIAGKNVRMHNFFATQVYQFWKTLGGETDFILTSFALC